MEKNNISFSEKFVYIFVAFNLRVSSGSQLYQCCVRKLATKENWLRYVFVSVLLIFQNPTEN